MTEMTRYRRHLIVPPDDINAVHDFMREIWEENPQIPVRDQFSFETALVELVANIISYSVAAAGVTCEIIIETSNNRIDATISDNGDLVELLLDEHIMPDELAESGRGIPLMRALVDTFSLDTQEEINTWRLSKMFRQ